MCQQLRAECIVKNVWEGRKGKTFQLVVNQHQRDGFKPEVKITLLGDYASGKSTLLGVLTCGKLDNGKGLARLSILNHKHEVLSGVTSSETYTMLGFDENGNVTNNSVFRSSSEGFFDSSTKIMSFYDQGGHQKYSKSLVQSLITNCSDYALIVVNPLEDCTNAVSEYFRVTKVLQIPTFIVITHLDMIDDNRLQEVLHTIRKCKRAVNNRLHLLLVRDSEDIVFFGKNINEDILPVFAVSNLTGLNINALKKFLNVLPITHESHNQETHKSQFVVTSKFIKDDMVIISGSVMKGRVAKRQSLFIGPCHDGTFKPVEITSVHCYKVPVRMATCGQSCTLGLREKKGEDKWLKMLNIKKGMVLVEATVPPTSSSGFVAEFQLFDENEIQLELPPFYEPVVTSQTFKHTCYILKNGDGLAKESGGEVDSLDSPLLTRNRSKSRELHQMHKRIKKMSFDSDRMISPQIKSTMEKLEGTKLVLNKGKTLLLKMYFKYSKQYVVEGQKVIICDQKTKAFGVVKSLIR